MNELKCNLCGKKMHLMDTQNDFNITKKLGYGSFYDDEKIEIHICCNCIDNLIESCKISPIISR